TNINSVQALTGATTFYNLQMGSYYSFQSIASGSTVTVTGLFTYGDGRISNGNKWINGGQIEAQGDINCQEWTNGGTTVLMINGVVDQRLTAVALNGGSVCQLLRTTINKSGGTLTLSGLIYESDNWTYTAGGFDAGTSTV